MKYNKFQFHKTNDKKILHKVRKQWVVFSVATLAMLGAGAVKTQQATHANADANHQSTQKMNVSDQQNHSTLITPHHDQAAATGQQAQTTSNTPQSLHRDNESAGSASSSSQPSSESAAAEQRMQRRMYKTMPTKQGTSSTNSAQASQVPKDPRYKQINSLAIQGHNKFVSESNNIMKNLENNNVSGPKASEDNTSSASSALSKIESEASDYNKLWQTASNDVSETVDSLKASNYGSTTFSHVNDMNRAADSAAQFQNQISSTATIFSSAISAESKSTSMNFGSQRQQILNSMSNNAVAISSAMGYARTHHLSNANQAYTELAQINSNFQAASNSVNQELSSAQTALKTTSGVDSAESAIQAADQNDSSGHSDAINASNAAKGQPLSKASSSAGSFSLNQSSLASDEASLSQFSNQVNKTLQPESGSIGKAYQMYQSYAKAHPNSKATSTISTLSNIASSFNKYSSAASQEISNASTDFKIAGSYSNNSSVVSKATDAAVKCVSAAKKYFGAANYLYTGKSSVSSSDTKSGSNQATQSMSNDSNNSDESSDNNETEPNDNSDEDSEGVGSDSVPQSEGATGNQTAADSATGSQNTGNANVSGASTGTTTNNSSQSSQQLPQTGDSNQVMGKAGVMLMLISLAVSALKVADDSRRRN